MIKNLTDKQKIICKKDGKFVVRACPGSGKTFTVAAKMARLLGNWNCNYRGIGVISFTNVAAKEVEKELNENFRVNTPIKHPHFIGTIDSFINQQIFFPYGHKILNCKCRPILVGEPAYPWNKNENSPFGFHGRFFDKLSHDINGKIQPISNLRDLRGGIEANRRKLRKMKYWFHKHRGYVNQLDVNYFSMRLLKKYPEIAKKVALRFPYLIIDEAQDTSDIQMKIIEIIVEKGLDDVVLVGDPDQAIFEFNAANPQLFTEKAQKWGKDELNESWRSSQNICNFTNVLSTLNDKTTSINENVKNCQHSPEIWGYDNSGDNCFGLLIEMFLKRCKEYDIHLNDNDIAILARSNSTVRELISYRNNRSTKCPSVFEIWGDNDDFRELAYSKYLYDKFEFQKSFKILEKTYMSILRNNRIYSDYKLKELIENEGYFNFKSQIYDLIKLMPKTNKSIGEWKDEFEVNIKNQRNDLEINLDMNEEYRDFYFDDLNLIVSNEKNQYEYRLSTIHGVKGETFRAVMLILKERTTNSGLYKTLLGTNCKTEENEELRNVYVGITRPQQILVLAVPKTDEEDWSNHFKIGPQSNLDSFF